ncbi:hypothetical protein AURDEDRAFT_152967 [Auricularia subglabra TFB-10046 SS5]|nr:hypothetical protein AURDEDRAFT_152967 [Auricularia subglabra TFB-10046 SS5]
MIDDVEDEDDARYELPVYGARRRGNNLTAWIESDENEAFEIVIRNTNKTDQTSILCVTYVDGVPIDGTVIPEANQCNGTTVCGVEDRRRGTLRRMFFKPVKITDDESAATRKGQAEVLRLGVIRIGLFHVECNGVMPRVASSEDDSSSEDNSNSEDDSDSEDDSEDNDEQEHRHALDADAVVHKAENQWNTGHHAILGEEEPLKIKKTTPYIEPLDKTPFLIFKIRYAPRSFLEQLKGVVPDPPTAHPHDRHLRNLPLRNLPDLNEEPTPMPGAPGSPHLQQNPPPPGHSTRRESTASTHLQRDIEGPAPRVKREVDEREGDLQNPQPLGARSSGLKRRARDEVPEPQPGKRSTRKRVKVESEREASSEAAVHSVRVKREAGGDVDTVSQRTLYRNDSGIERTVEVDTKDYVAALEAQNCELQARLPESERVRIVKK